MNYKKMILIIAIIIFLGASSYYGYGWYQDRQESIRLEEERESALHRTNRAYKLLPGTWTKENSQIEITFYENGSYYLVDYIKGNLRGKWRIAPDGWTDLPDPRLWFDDDWMLFLITDDDVFWAWNFLDGPQNKGIFHRKIK